MQQTKPDGRGKTAVDMSASEFAREISRITHEAWAIPRVPMGQIDVRVNPLPKHGRKGVRSKWH